MRKNCLVACLALFAACGDNNNKGTPDAHQHDAPKADAAIDAVPDAPPDAPPDAAPTAAELIAAARATADGTGLTLPITGATVTFVKPALGSDVAGFTIQATQTGPALFIAVDPATLTPPPVRGDVVSFTITTMATNAGLRQATALTGFSRTATGGTVTALVQNLTTATDVITALDSYESEIVDVTGSIAGAFVFGGSMFEKATITTTGITGDANYTVRLPQTLRDGQDAVVGCGFTLHGTPVGRLNGQVQLSAFSAADVTLTACPAPTVVSAVATSATSLHVTFSRRVLASSLMANGSQFTFDNGLTATAAAVNGRIVTVTTATQIASTAYLLTVANTLTDLQGTTLGTPSTATFSGFTTPAVVRINEVNANSSCDLIELRVVSGGSMAGYKLLERDTQVLVTFPTLNVAKNDFIVVHMNNSASCNPGTAVNETTAPNQQPTATFAANYDTAYDFYSTDTGLTSTDNVFTLYDATNAIMDAVFLSDDPAGATAATATETQAALVGAANQWSPALATYLDTVFRTNAADDLNATGTTVAGTSIQRLDNTDDNDKADWTTGAGAASTWGAMNPGQTAF